MSAATEVVDKVKGKFFDLTEGVKQKIFGTNNENIDFVMDSFYKLEPSQRNAVLLGIIGGIGLFVLAAVWLYFAQVSALKKELSQTFAAMHEFENLQTQKKLIESEFDGLVKSVSRKTNSLKIKPFFEKLAKQHQVTIEGLEESRVPLPADNPLSERMEQISVKLRLPKISIPKLLNFLVEIEKAGKYLRIQDLQVQGRYGTKLFFDANVKTRGYIVK
ncbi:MAG: hypothetical protein R3B45_01435 [Bdellovibrionota bacterium]